MFVKNNPLEFKYFNTITSQHSTEEQHIFVMELPVFSEHANQILDI